MRSCSGDVPATAMLGEEPCFAALMADPFGHPPSVPFAPLTSSLRSKPSVVKALSLICGGSPPHPETTDPRGQSARNPSTLEPLTLSLRHHLDPLTLRHGCQNTKGNLLQVVSGGLPFPFPPHHLSPPSTADIPDNGPVSALLFVHVSVSRVNSTTLKSPVSQWCALTL